MDHATALILRTLNVKGLVTSSDTYFIRKQILEYLDDHIERSGLGLLNEISLITLGCLITVPDIYAAHTIAVSTY